MPASTDVVVRTEGLGKKYRLGSSSAAYSTLRDTLAELLAAPVRGLRSLVGRRRLRPARETIWALRDIDLRIHRGEVLGIIGANGAGKTTLLKILSRITPPTTGRVELCGRVGSLLEIGTGFHPELTGRENIFLNGAILGMRRTEIGRKFDEIVAFAEIDRFLDTPVKRYSSGMYVRLAFAVAANLEPEILIVDEVLAVGDAAFRKKCLGKMDDVSQSGRTVIFVSHNMAAVQNLCTRVIWMDNGTIVAEDESSTVIERYHEAVLMRAALPLGKRTDRTGSGKIRFQTLEYEDLSGVKINSLRCGMTGRIVLRFDNPSHSPLNNLHVAISIDSPAGDRITQFSSAVIGADKPWVSGTASRAVFEIERTPLMPGRYPVTVFSTINGYIADWVQNAGVIEVADGDFYGSGTLLPQGQGTMLINYGFMVK